MFFFKVLYFAVLINLLGLDFVKLEQETSIEEKVKSWVKIENDEIYKIYYFNITNLDDFIRNKDDKLKVDELEPLFYKANQVSNSFLGMTSNESVAKFDLQYSYDFEKTENFDENKTFTTIETTVVDILDESPKNLSTILGNYIGYTRLAFKKSLLTANDNLVQKFNYEVDTGKNDSSLEGKIHSVNGYYEGKCLSKMCSKSLKGSSSAHLQFLRKKSKTKDESKFVILFADKPMTFLYDSSYMFKGLNVSRYFLDKSEISMKSDDNKCLCEDRTKQIEGVSLCEMDGILDAKKCAKIAKVNSNPHFFDASAVVQDHVKGLKPDPLKHRSYIEIDPVTDIVLNYRLSMQTNAFIRLSHLGQKPDRLVPYFWSSRTLERSDEFMKNFLKQRAYFI